MNFRVKFRRCANPEMKFMKEQFLKSQMKEVESVEYETREAVRRDEMIGENQIKD
ncbi:hypothetical protein YC2023_045328 [Brassica napus]